LLKECVVRLRTDMLVQAFGNRLQLLVALQTAPIERLAAGAVDRIADRRADLGLDFAQFRVAAAIGFSGEKGDSCAVSGPFDNPPRVCRMVWRNWVS